MNAVRATSNEVSANKKTKSFAQGDADKLVKGRRETSMMGNTKRSSTLRHPRNSTTLQSALPRAVEATCEARATDATRRAALGPLISCCYKRICAANTVEGRPTQVAKHDELPAGSPEDDKKRAEHANHICWNNYYVQLAQIEKWTIPGGRPQHSQKHKCGSSRSLLGVRHNLLTRL